MFDPDTLRRPKIKANDDRARGLDGTPTRVRFPSRRRRWWGAWLNNNKNKKVIAPINWFGTQANLYTGDIIPKKWISI